MYANGMSWLHTGVLGACVHTSTRFRNSRQFYNKFYRGTTTVDEAPARVVGVLGCANLGVIICCNTIVQSCCALLSRCIYDTIPLGRSFVLGVYCCVRCSHFVFPASCADCSICCSFKTHYSPVIDVRTHSIRGRYNSSKVVSNIPYKAT